MCTLSLLLLLWLWFFFLCSFSGLIYSLFTCMCHFTKWINKLTEEKKEKKRWRNTAQKRMLKKIEMELPRWWNSASFMSEKKNVQIYLHFGIAWWTNELSKLFFCIHSLDIYHSWSSLCRFCSSVRKKMSNSLQLKSKFIPMT